MGTLLGALLGGLGLREPDEWGCPEGLPPSMVLDMLNKGFALSSFVSKCERTIGRGQGEDAPGTGRYHFYSPAEPSRPVPLSIRSGESAGFS